MSSTPFQAGSERLRLGAMEEGRPVAFATKKSGSAECGNSANEGNDIRK